jgi:hypothetical protein
MITNRQQAIKMGKNAYIKVREKFDISKIANNHIVFYSDIIK